MIVNRSQQHTRYSSELHRVVFESVFVKCAIGALLVAFLIQPIAPAYANALERAESPADEVQETVEQETSEEVVLDETEDSSEIELEQLESEEVVSTDEMEESVSDDVTQETIDAESKSQLDDVAEFGVVATDVVDDTNSSKEVVASSTQIDTEVHEPDVAVASSSPETNESFASTTDETSTILDDSIGTTTNATSSTEGSGGVAAGSGEEEESVVGDDVETTETTETNVENDATEQVDNEDVVVPATSTVATTVVATTTDAQVVATKEATSTTAVYVQSLLNDQNRHQFSKDDCVAMGDGSFHCSKPGDVPEYVADGVFSIPDADGDQEILIRINGEETFITDNLVDDLAPYYDGLSKRIVWHSLINDRYQIASYDLASKEIDYLTDATYNNMEPVAYDDVTLWQAWVENNWEIMMYDGATTTQLTDSAMNDIAPQIRGGYILWQTQFADGWKVAMFDQETKQVEYIGDADGALAANPRFVLVYDSLDANGDVRTVGFDLDSRELVPFAQVPSQLPEELPEPQGSEETRALIQNKSNSKDNEIVDIDPSDPDNPFSATSTPHIATSTPYTASSTDAIDIGTLDLTQASSTVATSTNGVIEDVVVQPAREKAEQEVDTLLDEALNATATDHIEDVIIPPVATSTDEVLG